jgi:3-oxoacyl-[acyl-carrier protein] reductase
LNFVSDSNTDFWPDISEKRRINRTGQEQSMEEMKSLRGKVIVVARPAQRIGRAIAASAIDLNAMVVGVDLNAEKLEAPATAKNGYLPLPYVGSVTEPEFAEAMVRERQFAFRFHTRPGDNAGITRPAMIEKMTLQ